MKIISIVGARPQFIKAAPVSKILRQHHQEIIVHTGQHYDEQMSQIFFDALKIPRPDINLGVGSNSHACQTANMLLGIEKTLQAQQPDFVLVYGDTNSTLSGALAASKLNLKIAHIEAGLRSFNRTMPEEINRILTDRVADILFCPTKTAVNNLAKEGITQGVHNIGDVMFDAALQFESLAIKQSQILSELALKAKHYLLLTLHRPQNTDSRENLTSIIQALIDSNEKIIFPVHPRTKKFIKIHGLKRAISLAENLLLIQPVNYLDMVMLEKNAKKIITDSGGVQKEAYFFKVPCITLRDETEWVETVADGWNCLVGADRHKILQAINNFEPNNEQQNHYGEGKASYRLQEILQQYIKQHTIE